MPSSSPATPESDAPNDLDRRVVDAEDFLVCPISKQRMERSGRDYRAPCGFTYPEGDFRVNLDFSPHWAAEQEAYEKWLREWRQEAETIPGRREAIDAAFDDVYCQISLDGLVLDVAGDIGTVVTQANIDPQCYVSLDTMRVDFAAVEREFPNYAAHYRRSRDVCFIQGNAEYLPVKDAYFDTVHLRGCLDHFTGPHLALFEAYRVLRPGGKVVVGVTLEGAYQKEVGDWGPSTAPVLQRALRAGVAKLKEHPQVFGPLGRLKSRLQGVEDHHLFHPTHESLLDLIARCGFIVETEVWQKAYHNVLYVAARRSDAVVPWWSGDGA